MHNTTITYGYKYRRLHSKTNDLTRETRNKFHKDKLTYDGCGLKNLGAAFVPINSEDVFS